LPTRRDALDVVVLLPGDGIGPEVAAEARQVLELLAPEVRIEERLLGGAAIRATGSPLPDDTREACLRATAVLKGPVGDPEFEAGDVRPEQGLLGLRAALDTYANLRPAIADGVDILIVRELVGGLYFGARGTREDGTVFDTCEYHPRQVERIARRGFQLAQSRGKRLTSVDKANVLETSRMWRRVVDGLAPEYPDVVVDHMLVDNAAMQLAVAPERFDVLVTDNMFGDILSDLAAAVTGGLGLAPSASLSDGGPGLFEPVHGSAPDIAGAGTANPTAMLRSTALMLEHGLGRREQALALARAIDEGLALAPTPDLGGSASTRELGEAIRGQLAVDVEGSGTYRGVDASRA
jgi:3-isopropylmalate dehydrogenase